MMNELRAHIFGGLAGLGVIFINLKLLFVIDMKMKKEVKIIVSEIVEKLKREYKPLRIILFGSYAYGNPTEDSDIDLLILKNTDERRVDRFVQVKRIIYNPNCKIPVSPLVYSPEELEERLRIGDDFIKEIIQKGIILYEGAGS